MKATPRDVTVLVASDNVDDATQIARSLEAEHPHMHVSTNAETAVDDFERLKPDVLVLAFDAIEKAERYSLGLYRQSGFVKQRRHRTVLLCTRDELRAAVDVCKRGVFDDYVLYWPHAHDGMRLMMSVWVAARDTIALAQLASARETGQPAASDSPLAHPPPAAQEPQALPQQHAAAATVLVVEDDPFASHLIARALRGPGYELLFAQSGGEALEIIRRTRPDLILMDVNLPDVDGVTLTRELKALPGLADIPVLMLTGEARRETIESSMSAGAAGFMVKPFTRDALIAKMRRILSAAR
jgi:CheY-like chemotaxis protein